MTVREAEFPLAAREGDNGELVRWLRVTRLEWAGVAVLQTWQTTESGGLPRRRFGDVGANRAVVIHDPRSLILALESGRPWTQEVFYAGEEGLAPPLRNRVQVRPVRLDGDRQWVLRFEWRDDPDTTGGPTVVMGVTIVLGPGDVARLLSALSGEVEP